MARFEMCRGAEVRIEAEPHKLMRRLEGDIWQLECCATGRLREHSEVELMEMLRTGRLSYATSQGEARPPIPYEDRHTRRTMLRTTWEGASVSAKRKALFKLVYAKAAIELPQSKKLLQEKINEISAERPEKQAPSVSSVQRWTAAYVAGGKDVAALLDRNMRKGNRKSRIPLEVELAIFEAIDARYLTRERPTLQDALDDAIARVGVMNRSRRQRGEPSLPLATRRMVRSAISRLDPYDVCVARYGVEYASHKYRMVLKGHIVSKGLQRAEIDHTIVNAFVVDERSFLPLGRPYLSLLIEVRHRVILGYALSFEPPSYLSVMRCLKHGILPKTYLKSRYPDIIHCWNAYGVMDSLGLDNGKDFESNGLRDAADRFGIDLDYCPVRRPWIKGVVERAIGSINRGISHGLPGTTFENLIERGDYNSLGSACITLASLHEAIHIWIVDYYHQRVHRTLGVAPQFSWDEEMKRRSIPLPTSSDELDQVLAVPDRRVLSHKGIQLDHLFYNVPACHGILAMAGGPIEVEIRKPADDVGHIYVLDPRTNEQLKLPVIERYKEYATGLTPWQHAQCVKFAARQYGGRNDALALADAKRAIRSIFVKCLGAAKGKAKKTVARFLKADQALPMLESSGMPPPALEAARAQADAPLDLVAFDVTYSPRHTI